LEIKIKSLFIYFSSGLFTPDEAFEYIVQMQISKFEEPILKCVEMVTLELLNIIHEATSKVSFSVYYNRIYVY